MGSLKKSLDNIVRLRRKLQNIAIISVAVIGLMSIGLLATTYQMRELNQSKLDELVQHQNQIEMDTQATLGLKKELDKSKTEIDKLKMQLAAEKSIAQSLKEKLADTLKLLTQTQETKEMEATISKPQSTPFATIPSENNFDEKVQRPLQTPPASITSLNKDRSVESEAKNLPLNSQINADKDGKKGLAISTKPTISEPDIEKPGALVSPKEAFVETTTSQTVEPSKPNPKTALPSAESVESEPTQPSDSKSETPANNDPDKASLE